MSVRTEPRNDWTERLRAGQDQSPCRLPAHTDECVSNPYPNRSWINRMSPRTRVPAVEWVARVLAIAFAAITAVGWWDEARARQEPTLGGTVPGTWFDQWAIPTHFLPLLLIVAAIIVGWRRPLIAAIGFAIYAVLQAIAVGTEWAYLPLVVAPPALIAILYLIGWSVRRRAKPA